MTKRAAQLLEAAKALSDNDRVHLVEELLRTLEPSPDHNAMEAWAEEIDRRTREIDEDRVELINWDEVRRRARERLG